jgi:hypothetical protein
MLWTISYFLLRTDMGQLFDNAVSSAHCTASDVTILSELWIGKMWKGAAWRNLRSCHGIAWMNWGKTAFSVSGLQAEIWIRDFEDVHVWYFWNSVNFCCSSLFHLSLLTVYLSELKYWLAVQSGIEILIRSRVGLMQNAEHGHQRDPNET